MCTTQKKRMGEEMIPSLHVYNSFPCNSSTELQNFGIIGRNNNQPLFLHNKCCHAFSYSLGVHSNCVPITQGWYRGGLREDRNTVPGDRGMSLLCSCFSICSSQGNLLHNPSLLSCSASVAHV